LALARLWHASNLDSSVVAPRGKDERRYPHTIANRPAAAMFFFCSSNFARCAQGIGLSSITVRLGDFISDEIFSFYVCFNIIINQYV
jgi:hypothetical protein